MWGKGAGPAGPAFVQPFLIEGITCDLPMALPPLHNRITSCVLVGGLGFPQAQGESREMWLGWSPNVLSCRVQTQASITALDGYWGSKDWSPQQPL